MNHIKKTVTLLLILSIFLLANVQQVESRGLGVGPNYIALNSALKNSTYQHTIYIYNENDFDIDVELEILGEPNNWIKFFEVDAPCCGIKVTNIKNNSNKPLDCKISIPGDIANGLYEGVIYINMMPPAENITGDTNFSTVTLSLPIELFINVTGDQDYNVSVGQISIKNVEIGYPASIKVHFGNNGNVKASPTIEVTITKDDMYIDKITSKCKTINPGNSFSHSFNWDTIGKVSGRYNAYFKIYDGEKHIKQTNVSFELFPPGTIERNGTLEEIKIEGILEKGKIVKIIATFLNEGAIDLEAQFFGEIYLDGELIGTIDSSQGLVPKYKTHQFISYLTLASNGEYTIKGYVNYGGMSTESKEYKFTVGNISSTLDINLIILLVLIIFVVIILYIFKFKKKNKNYEKLGFKKPKISTSTANDSAVNGSNVPLKKKRKLKLKSSKRTKIKKKKEKPLGVSLENMSAKDIEEYVKGL